MSRNSEGGGGGGYTLFIGFTINHQNEEALLLRNPTHMGINMGML